MVSNTEKQNACNKVSQKMTTIGSYLASEASPGGGEVDLWDDGCCIRWYLRVRVPGRHEETEVFMVVDHLVTDLDNKPGTCSSNRSYLVNFWIAWNV